MSSYLLDERPLVFLPGLGRAFGITPALLLQQLHYYLRLDGGIDDAEGIHWTWQKIEGLRECLGDAIDESTIRRALGQLEGTGVLVSAWMAEIDPTWDRRDRTKAYRIDYDVLSQICGQPAQAAASKVQIARLQAGKPRASKCAKNPKHISTETTGQRSQAEASRARGPASAAAGKSQQQQKPNATSKVRHDLPNGVVCWVDPNSGLDDRPDATILAANASPDEIRAGVTAVEATGKDPVPGLVWREIRRQRAAREKAEQAKAREAAGPLAEARRRHEERVRRDADPAARQAGLDAARKAAAELGFGGPGVGLVA